MEICPYLQASFEVLGRRWNGLIIHYLSNCTGGVAHFSDMKRDLKNITPRSLSLKLNELAEHGLVVKRVDQGPPIIITYHLTEKGNQLASALQPIQAWAQQYIELEQSNE